MPVTTDQAVPTRAQGLELLGAVAGSGHRRPPALVRRGDGQTFQLTPIADAVLSAIDGDRDLGAIAAEVEHELGVRLERDDVAFLVEEKLRPLGVLRELDGSEPEVERANPLLALRWRVVVSNPAVTDRITAPFARLFRPPVVVFFTLAFVGASWWLLLHEGLATAARDVLYQPALLLTVFGLTMLSAGFHELGHAAACRYGGARPGAMGAGLYLVWPAFYTDVSDSYRLPRRDRLRVDLGGLYFNAVFAVVVFAAALLTGWDALFVIVPLQQLQMLQQLVPFVRLDGYHILADVVGVPDLYAHIKPTLRRLLPAGRRERPTLKRWARWVVTGWVALVVPVLAFSLLLMVVTLPRFAATAADSIGRQAGALREAWNGGDLAGTALRAIAVASIAVPLLSVTYLLSRIGRRILRRAWVATDERPARRVAFVGAVVALALFAGAAWWPDGQYEPIRQDERGTLLDGARAVQAADASPAQSTSLAHQWTVTDDGVTMPLQLVAAAQDAAEGGRFRFQLPAAPGSGDNQAFALNEVDGSTVVDVALSLVWATDGTVVNANEAWALASCRECSTSAFAFQLVLIVGDAEVVVPQNIAVAINDLCAGCVTRALAIQLIVMLARPLDDGAMARIATIWRDLEAVAAAAAAQPAGETEAAMRSIESQLLTVLEPYLATEGSPSSSTTSTTSASSSSTTSTTETTTTASTAPASQGGSSSTTATTTQRSSTTSSTTTSSTTSSTSSTTTSTTAPTTTTTAPESTTTTTAPADDQP